MTVERSSDVRRSTLVLLLVVVGLAAIAFAVWRNRPDDGAIVRNAALRQYSVSRKNSENAIEATIVVIPFPTANVRMRNIRSGRSGTAARRSTTRNAAASAAAATNSASAGVLPKPWSVATVSP